MKTTRELQTKLFDKINPAVQFSVTRYVMAIGIFVGIVTFGVVSVFNLGVALLPEISIPVVVVNTQYAGADPTVVSQQVTQVIENALVGIEGVTDMNSQSSSGQSLIIISFSSSVDKNTVLNQVAAVVSGLSRRLPSDITAPVVRSFDPNAAPIIQFAIDGGGAPLTEVNEYANNLLMPSLQALEGVASITINGGPQRRFEVLLDPLKLSYYGLTTSQVVNAIDNSAVNRSIGSITTKGNQIDFATNNIPDSISTLSSILVDTGRGITVNQLGAVRDSSTTDNFARINGQPVVLVSVQRIANSNSVAVADTVKAFLTKTDLPKGYKIIISNDTVEPVRGAIKNTYHELIITLIVVALIVLLFLGKPLTAFSVILAVPISLAASPILYALMGFSFNLVSLLAMVTAIGIVVDDSIVVAENVDRYLKMGLSHKDAVLRGASEIFSAVVAASLSILSVLLPVSFLPGTIGEYLRQFSLGLSAAVFFSLLEAMLFLTVRLAYTHEHKELFWSDFFFSLTRLPKAIGWTFKNFYKPLPLLLAVGELLLFLFVLRAPFTAALGTMPSSLILVIELASYVVTYLVSLCLLNYFLFMLYALLEALTRSLHLPTERFVEFVQNKYANSLRTVLRFRVAVILGSLALLIVTIVFIIPHIPFTLTPQSDSGSIDIRLRFARGTPQSQINDRSVKIEALLQQQPEVKLVQTRISDDAQINLYLKSREERATVFELVPKYRAMLKAKLKDDPTIQLSVNTGSRAGGPPSSGNGITISIVSPDDDLLRNNNTAVIDRFQKNPYVTDVNSSLSGGRLQNEFIANPEKLKGTGLTVQAIAAALNAYASGVKSANVVTGGVEYPIYVRLDATTVSTGQNLLDMPLYSPVLGNSIPIGQLGEFQLTNAPTTIRRYNRRYLAAYNLSLAPNAPTEVEMQEMLKADLNSVGLLAGAEITDTSSLGPAALAKQLKTTVPALFMLALFLAYLVMAAQFNSWRYPVYLLLPVPLALGGAFIVAFLKGGGLDIFGVLGMLMLIGLSAKNAILYLDFVVARMENMSLFEALIDAARLRFRPIVMTTLTVLVISGPLIFSGGEGSEYGQSLGLVMFGGITASAILTFFVVPCAFFIFEHRSAKRNFEARLASRNENSPVSPPPVEEKIVEQAQLPAKAEEPKPEDLAVPNRDSETGEQY